MVMIRCAFCGQHRKSYPEHFHPKWSRRLIPIRTDTRGIIIERGVATGKKMRGAVGTETLKEVCKPCNSIWMSQLQSKAKPFLEPLIVGDRIIITDEKASAISQWAVMTSMCIDAIPDWKSFIPAHVRKEYSESQNIGSDWKIYLGRTNSVIDRGWRRDYLYDNNNILNGCIIVFLIGRIFTVSIYQPNLSFKRLINLSKIGIFQLYPSVGNKINISDTTLPDFIHVRSIVDMFAGKYPKIYDLPDLL